MARSFTTSKPIRDRNRDVADQHPEVVERLRDFYEAWWAELEPTFANATAIYLGHPADNPARLTSHDWITTGSTPWNQSHIRGAMTGKANTGFWNVMVHEAGDYEVRSATLAGGVGSGNRCRGCRPVLRYRESRPIESRQASNIHPTKATLRIADVTVEAPVHSGDKEVVFDIALPAGKTKMTALFESADGEMHGAYYAYVKKK